MDGKEIMALADAVSRTPAYSGRILGTPIRKLGDLPSSGSLDNEVILINVKHRDILVTALRAYAGGPLCT